MAEPSREHLRAIIETQTEIGASFGLAAGLEDPAALHAAADSELLAAKDDLYGRPGIGPPTA